MAATAGPRYAPEDPTVPKPWRGLIDGNTGYLYFWNPETNVTQYERPVVIQPSGPPAAPPPQSTSTSVHLQKSSGYLTQREFKEDDGRYGGSRSHQNRIPLSSGPSADNHINGIANNSNGASYSYDHMHSSQVSTPAVRGHESSDNASITPESYCHRHEITVRGDGIPPPFMTFEATGFPAEVLREVHHAGFSAPTPIQAQSWPIAIQSRDIVAIAKTGSGKTLGYLFPAFLHLNRVRNNSRMGPTVLVLAPTRELATQILDEAVKFGKSSRMSSTCLYGGAPKGPQLRDLDRGVDIVVATPGRLNDILEMRRVSLRQVSYLVLDEADRMLDMGFEPQIRKIVKEIPLRRQTLMFTATWPKEVRKIAADLLVSPVQVNIGNVDELVANKAITQYVEVVMPMEKQRRLEQILRSQEPGSKVLVFCSTKKMCDLLARSLARQFQAAVIHGDKSQSERDYVLGQFRTGRSPILVATDVAARGLDVKDIRVVINFDFPTGVEDYVHRIGRTGRAGATGVAYTFFSDQDAKHASDLIKVLEGADQRVPPEIRAMGTRGGYGKFSRWGSGSGDSRFGGRDAGRSYNSGRNDTGFGGRRGGRGLPSGRSESSFGGRGIHERYERSYHDSYEENARGHRDSKSTLWNSDRSDTKTSWSNNDYRKRDLRQSRSRSPSRNVSHATRNYSRSRSRCRSRSRNRGQNPSRSNYSHSLSRSPKKIIGGAPSRSRSPNEPIPSKMGSGERSPPSSFYQRGQRSPYDGNIPGKIVVHEGTPCTGDEQPRSPCDKLENNGWEGSVIPAKELPGESLSLDALDHENVADGYINGQVASSFQPHDVEEEEGMIQPDDEVDCVPPMVDGKLLGRNKKTVD